MVDGQGADDAGNVAPVDVFQFQGVEGPPEVDWRVNISELAKEQVWSTNPTRANHQDLVFLGLLVLIAESTPKVDRDEGDFIVGQLGI